MAPDREPRSLISAPWGFSPSEATSSSAIPLLFAFRNTPLSLPRSLLACSLVAHCSDFHRQFTLFQLLLITVFTYLLLIGLLISQIESTIPSSPRISRQRFSFRSQLPFPGSVLIVRQIHHHPQPQTRSFNGQVTFIDSIPSTAATHILHHLTSTSSGACNPLTLVLYPSISP